MGLVNELTIDDLKQDRLEKVASQIEKGSGEMVISKDRVIKEIGEKLASLSPQSRSPVNQKTEKKNPPNIVTNKVTANVINMPQANSV